MERIDFSPIGLVHSPFKKLEGIPIQPKAAKDVKGFIEIFKDFEEGLEDIEGFSHIIILFYFHLSKGYSLKVIPYMDKEKRGVFATRSPSRPNSIGLSVVKLLSREKNILYVQGLDIVDLTPVLDIKPYVPQFDTEENFEIGWLKKRVYRLSKTVDDGRFKKD